MVSVKTSSAGLISYLDEGGTNSPWRPHDRQNRPKARGPAGGHNIPVHVLIDGGDKLYKKPNRNHIC